MFSSKSQGRAKGKMWKKRWLFHATDFQSLMYPCFTFCCILGIFPYKINASTFEASKPRYILSTIVIFVYFVYTLKFMHDIIISKTINFGDITRNLQIICYYILSGSIVIITHVLSGPRMRLLQTISEISSQLPSQSYEKLSRLIHVKDILSTIILVVQEYIYFFKIETLVLSDTLNGILIMVFTIYITQLVFQIDMLYMNCVCVLKACFKRINDNLAHIQRLIINDIKQCTPTLICHMQRNQFLPVEIKTLKKQHLMVSNAVQMLNVIFSLQLLATVVIVFSEITFELYSHAVRWQNGIFISFDEHFFNMFFMFILYYIVKMPLLVWACETGKNQALQIATTIHDVLNSTSDEQIKNELRLFSLQILHCKNTFSAKGLTMDATLLTAMLGSITTYMLILIQFLIMSHSCDEKSAINVT